MSHGFKGWNVVSQNLRALADGDAIELNEGQRRSLHALADRIPKNGVLLADEVGMGKTRIACSLAKSVIDAGGRVAVLVPPGLGFQWQEELHRSAAIVAPPILRSLWQYLKTWEDDTKRPWFKESCVIASHAFANWKLGEGSQEWRWQLLPELYAIGTNTINRKINDPWVKNAAQSILAEVNTTRTTSPGCPMASRLDEIINNTPWPDAGNKRKSGHYAQGTKFRVLLEQAIGMGLGNFDLVVIDEAHKSRGDDSGLSRMLDTVILHGSSARRLAMTATPVELDIDQWRQSLGRIGIQSHDLERSIACYAEAVRNVRRTPGKHLAKEAFSNAARNFETSLSPYLLRRDKREDSTIKAFVKHTKENHHSYRRFSKILVNTADLSPKWKVSVCAAEALSFVARNTEDSVSKRLRLTLGNGHGIAALIDQLHYLESNDKDQSTDSGIGQEIMNFTNEDKRLQRAAWWRDVLLNAHHGDLATEATLFNHPAILAAVKSIEGTIDDGEKVLVFGRFTRPLRALANLLNARRMFLTLDAGGFWPQQHVHESEWPAIEAAHRQLGRIGKLDRTAIDLLLKVRYQELEDVRKGFRESLINRLEEGFAADRAESTDRSLFVAFKASAANAASGKQTLATVSRALSDHLGSTQSNISLEELVQAFSELVSAASDRDPQNQDGLDDPSESYSTAQWQEIEARIREDYSHAQGGFARLMHGETAPPTRRLLQLAFNRRNTLPQVLVAQSVVGREGLNLHKACRTVVLLHPEWNPGVVEQQIGRVDRLGSLWEEMLQQAISQQVEPSNVPRIEIRPVVFEGTYDESNWQVLNERWDELRAQLHGVILSFKEGEDDEMSRLYDEINRLAPHFSPTLKNPCH